MRVKLLLLALCLGLASFLNAQNIAVGQWRAHLPQRDPLRVVQAGDYIYAWTSHGFCRYHMPSNETEQLSTVNGYTEVGISYAAYHPERKILVIAYQNSNIDLLFDNGTIVNVPDLYNASVNGSKEISKISFYNEYALISCGFGVLVYNLDRMESSADYKSNLIVDVKSTEVFNNQVYVATNAGLFSAPLPPAGISIAASSWSEVSTGEYHDLVPTQGGLIAWHDTVIDTYDGNTFNTLLMNKEFRSICTVGDEIFLTTSEGVYLLNENPVGFYDLKGSRASIRIKNDWIYASEGFGIIRKYPSGELAFLSPRGPYRAAAGTMDSYDNKLYIGGGVMLPQGGATYTYNGYYTYTEGFWENSIETPTQYLDSFYDIHAVTVDHKTGRLWVAGLEEGIVELAGKQIISYYDEFNSPLQLKVTRGISSMKVDEKRNLWVANFESGSPLYVLSPQGEWDSFPGINPQASRVLELVIDNSGQKWLRFGDGLGVTAGILVYSDNKTPFDKTDDPYPSGKVLSTAGGSGGLPDNQVNCMAVDRNGQIWVGTEKGLAVFYSPSNILSTNPSDAKQIVVGSGDDVGYLLGDETINAILVDGGNRKWIASRSGLWLVSPDGQEILAYYNEDNSPLFTNSITQLGMVESTGELMIATDRGLISLGTGSSKAGDRHGEVKVYPNPVRPGYSGEISVSGLPQDAFVKITDIAGNVVYETRANGGTATWNGLRPDGSRASTGVYLIFSGNSDGSDTFVSKLLIVN